MPETGAGMAVTKVEFPGNIAQVDTVADLRALPSYSVLTGTLYVVLGLGRAFAYDGGSVSVDDGSNVIKPNDKTTLQAGRWLYELDGFAAGPPGPSDNTYSSLSDFQASDVDRKTASLVGVAGVPDGRFNWTIGNFTALNASNPNDYIKASSVSLSVGAWVRQKADGINFDGRSVNAKLLETVSVTDARFAGGADPTGSSDSIAAIRAAYAYLKSRPLGGRLRFPGDFVITDTLVIDHEDKYIEFEGDFGYSSRIRMSSDTAKPTLVVGSANYRSDNFAIRDLAIGPSVGAGAGGANDILVRLDKRGGCTFERCYFSGARFGIVLADSAFSTTISQCQFNGIGASAVTTNGADQSSNRLTLWNNRFYQCGRATNAVAAQINTGFNITIEDNTFEGCYDALFLNGTASVDVNRNYIENSHLNFYIQSGFSIRIKSNWLGLADSPTVIENVDGVVFDKNTVYEHNVTFGATAKNAILGSTYFAPGGATPSSVTPPVLASYVPFRLQSPQQAPAAPTTGTWVVRDVVWHSSPTPGGNVGWVCTTAGTPGTWKAFGTIAA